MRAIVPTCESNHAPAPFRARLACPRGARPEIGRIGWTTRESVAALVDDARLIGRGGRLEIRLFADEAPETRSWLGQIAGAMRRRGISMRVIHQGEVGSGAAAPERRAAA